MTLPVSRPYAGPLQAVVLDWAGTAVDYGCLGPVDVFVRAFAQHDIPVTVAEARVPMGLKKIDHVRAVLAMPAVAERVADIKGHPPTEADVLAIYHDTEAMMVAAIVDHAELIPGLLDAVAAFRAMGLKIGTSTGYTSSMMDVLVPLARRQGYTPDLVVCSTDVPAGRPSPFMCYKNALLLEVYPLEAMVKIGDTPSDVQEGLHAGMWTIALTRSGNELGLSKEDADALPPAELAARLADIEARFQAQGAHYVVQTIADCPAVLEDITRRLAAGERP
ncbi:phosphonoacetaldehyde hydrolase [Megalodesulfovibrio gigas]|uniref:phosphonoacetaldehyde hydrolase n=1 Tax=Megalodesulfovibrio gigas (strain ATCC 19364 / DSM 1382 / NCIMB 9332 / VKM B-1759) TaxID=1121448 RepID=T2G922_MEGG1|nr:phosphonoacetaldehyde hydrolase [Megalodesulfovibrio gigas]AGW12669.1 putative phosphonoacetaldehyde hydrolase [Megalodesulfovibrio gigas DSM 1382 = ATCC 19364]